MAIIKETNQKQDHFQTATLDTTVRELKKETMHVARDFTHFLTRSNAAEIASAMVLSSSVSAIVNSMINDILMPCIGALLRTNIKGLVLTFGSIHIAYGAFIQEVFNFIVMALVFYIMLSTVSKMRKKIEKIEKS